MTPTIKKWLFFASLIMLFVILVFFVVPGIKSMFPSHGMRLK